MIYATPFRASDKQPTGRSEPSGFASIAEAVAMMGPPDVYESATMAIYGPGEARVVFSALQFQIDEPASNG
jgi:hypothetical protein